VKPGSVGKHVSPGSISQPPVGNNTRFPWLGIMINPHLDLDRDFNPNADAKGKGWERKQ
jgi:hypothetical protein